MKRPRPMGFTLIELMVTIVILAILLVLGIPSYEQWIRNTRIRNAAESIQNGLRLARNEASQRGTYVEFYMSGSTPDWTVCQLASASTAATTCANDIPIQQFASAGGASNVTITNSTALADVAAAKLATPLSGSSSGTVIFNALGRPATYGTTSLVRIDASASATNSRRLVVTLSSGGMVRMCDPALTFSTATPQACH